MAIARAAQPICRKPNKAEAAPACCPKGCKVMAVPYGLIKPMPSKNTVSATVK